MRFEERKPLDALDFILRPRRWEAPVIYRKRPAPRNLTLLAVGLLPLAGVILLLVAVVWFVRLLDR